MDDLKDWWYLIKMSLLAMMVGIGLQLIVELESKLLSYLF